MDEYVKLSRLAKILGLFKRTLYYRARQGQIPGAIRFPDETGTWLVRKVDLEARLAELHQRAEASDAAPSRPKSNAYEPKSPIVREFQRRLEFARRGLAHPQYKRRVGDLRKAVLDGTATELEVGEERTWRFWRAWKAAGEPEVSDAVCERFRTRTVTEQDVAAVERKIRAGQRSRMSPENLERRRHAFQPGRA